MPPEFEHAIDDQRRELATAMTLVHCLHCVLRRESDDICSDESEAVEDATEWAGAVALAVYPASCQGALLEADARTRGHA
jgi:hypothetical protein